MNGILLSHDLDKRTIKIDLKLILLRTERVQPDASGQQPGRWQILKARANEEFTSADL
ncbi:hypothetical protein [Faecalibaculum rodentium]|jgi:hypothetical protein|uniref:hypothetical protein n=1 Tax=Faecalibaculum rodentium TaxID=1702221 RepID=UPI00261950F0|nr:hypothetical protein [Faecalibaculum rodentium]